LPRTVAALALKRAKPIRTLERRGDRLRFAQSLQTQSAHAPIRADSEYELNRTVIALHPPGQNHAERQLFLITVIDMERVFIAGGHAAEALGQFQTLAAENACFGLVTGGVRK